MSTRLHYVDPSDILPHPFNARVYGDDALDPDFVESIRVNGVQEPVVVVKTIIDGQDGLYILSGHRRVKAAARVGRNVPIRTVEDAGTLWQESFLLESNRQRIKTPEQKAREFTEFKRIEAALAKERMLAGKPADPRANLPQGSRGKARDKAAAKVGLKSRTAEKLEKVVQAADTGNVAARTALNEINAGTKSIHAAAKEVAPPKKRSKSKKEVVRSAASPKTKKQKRQAVEKSLRDGILATNLAGYATDVDVYYDSHTFHVSLDFVDDEAALRAAIEQFKKMDPYKPAASELKEEKPAKAIKQDADPNYEYIPDFLTSGVSKVLFDKLESQPGLIPEIGQCRGAKPSHATIQWGPRQAYLSCVPQEYRVRSSGDIPDWLMPLKLRLEEKYNCYFDSVQVNKHFDQDSQVLSHTDSPPGHICMISLGAEREFKLTLRNYKPLATIPLANGSLLTFFPNDQWKHTHSMPKSSTPCGPRYSLIFRYITEALQKPGAIDKATTAERKERNRLRSAEYEAVQAAYRSGGYAAVAKCLSEKSWI